MKRQHSDTNGQEQGGEQSGSNYRGVGPTIDYHAAMGKSSRKKIKK